jgi:hypothetical protein
MYYQITEGVLARPLDETIVLLHPETERLLTLSGSGPRIWELLSEELGTEEIIARLAEEFAGAESVIRRETLLFLDQLEQERVLHRVK